MTQSIYTQWDNSWTTTSIASTSITSSGGTATTSAISNDTKSGTEVAITCVMGTGDSGVSVYVLREVDGNYETTNDRPFGFMMPYNGSTTQRRAFVVVSDRCSNFKIKLVNNDSSAATCTVSYKQSTIEVA